MDEEYSKALAKTIMKLCEVRTCTDGEAVLEVLSSFAPDGFVTKPSNGKFIARMAQMLKAGNSQQIA